MQDAEHTSTHDGVLGPRAAVHLQGYMARHPEIAGARCHDQKSLAHPSGSEAKEAEHDDPESNGMHGDASGALQRGVSGAVNHHPSPSKYRQEHHYYYRRSSHHSHHDLKRRNRSRSRSRNPSKMRRSRSRSRERRHRSRSQSRDRNSRHNYHNQHNHHNHHNHYQHHQSNDNDITHPHRSKHRHRNRSTSRDRHHERHRGRSSPIPIVEPACAKPPPVSPPHSPPDRTCSVTSLPEPFTAAIPPICEGILGTPSRRVVHESTLVCLRSSASPRSHPLSLPEGTQLESPTPAFTAQERMPPRRFRLGAISFGSAQAKGLRPYMEDRHIMEQPLLPMTSSGSPTKDDISRSFAAVYDGHNGTLAAEYAQERLHQVLAAEPALRTCTGAGPPAVAAQEEQRVASALIRAFEITDKEILARCQLEGGRSGATGVVVVRIGETLYAAHCGDSRAVMCRGGEPLRLTEDHKPNLPRERQRVEALGGRVDFARCWRVIVDPGDGRPASGLAVSRSFGDPDFKQPLHLVTATPDVMRERLAPEDSFFVLASDGLWDVMSDKEACDIVAARLNADGVRHRVQTNGSHGNGDEERGAAVRAAEALVQASLEAGTMDNVTAVVGILHWS